MVILLFCVYKLQIGLVVNELGVMEDSICDVFVYNFIYAYCFLFLLCARAAGRKAAYLS